MRSESSWTFDIIALVVSYLAMSFAIYYFFNLDAFNPTTGFLFWYKNIDNPPEKLQIIGGCSLAFCLLLMYINPFGKVKHKHGDAQFANKKEVKKMHLLDDKGIILGLAFNTYLRCNEPLSILLLAPPGTGKTAGLVIPTLMSCGNSMVINDVKGELYEITSKRRSEFSKVMRFSPGEPGSSKWNPLDKDVLPETWIDKEVKIERLASVLYPYSENNHWMTEAKPMFLFYCLYLVFVNGGTSLPEVRSFCLSSGGEDIQAHIAELMETEGLPQRIIEEGSGLVAKADKEFGGVFSTFKSQLNSFADPYVQQSLSGNDFKFQDFRKERHSVYLVVKAEDVDRLSPIIRLFFEELALYILSEAPKKEDHTITLVIDEMVRLGKLEQVLNMPALSRGNRGNAILIAQDYEQIKKVYGAEGPGILNGTCAYRVILAQNNVESAKAISESIGDYSRDRESSSIQAGQFAGGKSVSSEGFKLLTAQNLMSMEPEDVYIIAQNYANRPVKGRQARWYLDKDMKKMAGTYEVTNG